ncbi:MAG: serine hydrolase [Patescibacteria group bacterium]|jgi:hypothetical protein
MKNKTNIIFLVCACLILFCQPVLAATVKKTAAVSLANQLSGRILIQVDSYGRPWYVYPKDKKRYYLKDGPFALQTLKSLATKITEAELNKIPKVAGEKGDNKIINKYRGYILLSEKNNNQFWYVNPVNGRRYGFTDANGAYQLIKSLGLGIKNKNLDQIVVTDSQLVFDNTFNNVAYVEYDGKNFTHAYYADKILPLASLTKLMTALVLLDLKPDWNKQITIKQDNLNYPKLYVGDDATSEVDFAAGDKMTFGDLWVAMLLASSNQAAATLVDSTGLSKDEFVKLMNKKAESLGLKKTVFYDVSGLNSHNVTTAKEMAKIGAAAFDISKIAETTVLNSYNISAFDAADKPKTIKVINRNYSLLKFEPQGAKTGFLIEAQRTVVLKKGSKIIAVMHALSMNQRNKIIQSLATN